MYLQAEIEQQIEKVCPIDGISFGNLDDKSTWRIDFRANATDEERSAAHDVLNQFTWDTQKEKDVKKRFDIETYRNDRVMRLLFTMWKKDTGGKGFPEFIDYIDSLEIE